VTTLFPEAAFNEIVEALEVQEGFRAHGYRDTLDNLTIGFGRCIEPGVGLGLTRDEARVLLENDVFRCLGEVKRWPWFDGLKPVHQSVLVQLCHQLGYSNLSGFNRMLLALSKGDMDTAADELLDSRFARQQTPARAQRLAQQLCR
jgi:lysozyme